MSGLECLSGVSVCLSVLVGPPDPLPSLQHGDGMLKLIIEIIAQILCGEYGRFLSPENGKSKREH